MPAQGLSATTGLGMLIEQAALAFEIWTGTKVSRCHATGSRMKRILGSARNGWLGANSKSYPRLGDYIFCSLVFIKLYYTFFFRARCFG
ncbi:MAG: hypothetical protein U0Z26_06950 [Anaerolineales bacterium]